MKYLYAKFVNYSRFYSGLGKKVLEIDFSKCRNNIVLIAGPNGSGKSSLRKALELLPDDSSMYLKGVPASKELRIYDNGDIYTLFIVSDVNQKGERKKTQAYISKNGEELNPNGNVSSYKETLFSLFDLDPNYITLSALSTEDRGIADKRPSERKQFVASIMDSVEVYNAMHKTLSKKASVLRGQLKGIESKMRGLGDPNILSTQYATLKNQLELTKRQTKEAMQKYADAQAIINEKEDPDGKLQEKYNILYNNIKGYRDQIKLLESKLQELNIEDTSIDFQAELDRQRSNINARELDIEKADMKISELINSREEDLHVIDIKSEKLKNLDQGVGIEQLEQSIVMIKRNIENTEEILKRSHLEGIELTKQEYVFIFETINAIESGLSVMAENYYREDLADIATYTNYNEQLRKMKSDLEMDEGTKQQIIIEIAKLKNDMEKLSILNKRPDSCKIDDCEFIKNVLSLKDMNLDKRFVKAQKDLEDLTAHIEKQQKSIDHLESIIVAQEQQLNPILMKANNPILKKIGFHIDETYLLKYADGDKSVFDYVRDSMRHYKEYADYIDEYNRSKNTLVKLEAEYAIAKNNVEVIEQLVNEVEQIRLKLENVESEIEKLNKQKAFDISVRDKLQMEYDRLAVAKKIIDNLNELQKKREDEYKEYETIRDSIGKIKDALVVVNEYKGKVESLEHTEKGLEESITQVQHNLMNLNQYTEEYAQCSEAFNVINTLKNYCSPTKEGIQSIFMDTYMGSTLNTCNQILGMLFQGQYQLMKYKIDDKEFRIPFTVNGFPVDDISSGSSSQVAMVGMVINLVLLHQASTKFNIAYFDEVDGPLDTVNRMELVPVIYTLLQLLGIEQLIMISHSIEIDLHNVDVILLKGYEGEDDKFSESNIIYDYRTAN